MVIIILPPLTALMQEMVDRFHALGISATFIGYGQLDNAAKCIAALGGVRAVFTAPRITTSISQLLL